MLTEVFFSNMIPLIMIFKIFQIKQQKKTMHFFSLGTTIYPKLEYELFLAVWHLKFKKSILLEVVKGQRGKGGNSPTKQ